MPNIIIKATKLDLTDEVKNYIEKKLKKFSRYYDNVLEIRAEVERIAPNHHRKGDVFRAEINLTVPKKTLRVEKTEANLRKAIDKVVDHMKEIIVEYKGKNQTNHP